MTRTGDFRPWWSSRLAAKSRRSRPSFNVRAIGSEGWRLVSPEGATRCTIRDKGWLIKAVAGLVPISGGHVRLEGAELTGAPAHEMTRRGLAYVPQTENVFATLSIADNLALAAQQWPAPQRGPRIARALELFRVG